MAQSWSAHPPFPLPPGPISRGDKGWTRITLPESISDGDASKHPPAPKYVPSDNSNYLIKLGTLWANHQGVSRDRMNYHLHSMPRGYSCYETPQPGGPQIYKRLFGHPSGRFYDSINKFQPHFFWMVNGKQGVCDCVLCGNTKSIPFKPRPRQDVQSGSDTLPIHVILQTRRAREFTTQDSSDDTSSRTQSILADRTKRRERGAVTSKFVDEEGCEDIWRDTVRTIEMQKTTRHILEEDIVEKHSIDWLGMNGGLAQYMTRVKAQHSFVPRIGELVLFIIDFPEQRYLQRQPGSQEYRHYSMRKDEFGQLPTWRAGVVAAVPSIYAKDASTDFTDILSTRRQALALNNTGYRIETFGDPNDDIEKAAGKQYRWLPLRNIRPFSHWQQILRGTIQSQLHESISYAMTCMTSVSLLGKYKILGEWPNAAILAKGMHLGAEMLCIGDTVRLVPTHSNTACTQVMVIDEVRLNLKKIQSLESGAASGDLCQSFTITIRGEAFSTNIEDAYGYHTGSDPRDMQVSDEEAKYLFRPVGTSQYGSWWRMQPSEYKSEVSHDQILGRLYEAGAVRLWSGLEQDKKQDKIPPDLSYDLAGILAARSYASKSDERMPEPKPGHEEDIQWLVSDYRGQALALATLNGEEIGKYQDYRTKYTMQMWRRDIRIAAGERLEPEDKVNSPRRREKNYNVRDAFGKIFHGSNSSHSQPTNGMISNTRRSGETRGRKVGSRLINGKIFSAAEVARLTTAGTARGPRNGIPANKEGGEDMLESESDEVVVVVSPTYPTPKHKMSSQMAAAAVESSTEDDVEGGFEDEEGDVDMTGLEEGHGAGSSSNMALYGMDGQSDDEFIDAAEKAGSISSSRASLDGQ